MPIPTPSTDEAGNADLGSCIRFLRRENPGMTSDQRVRICLDKWRKATGKPKYKEPKK